MIIHKIKKLNAKGFTHHLAVSAMVLVVAAIGIRVLIASNSSTPAPSPKVEFVSSAPKGLPPENLISNSPNVSTSPQAGSCQYGACYYWNYMATSGVKAQGVSVNILQADPKVGTSDIHSDSELMALSSDAQQIIEVGWIVAPYQYGDSLPHLFVYHWVNRVASCFDGCGFVPTSTQYTAGQTVFVGSSENYTIKHIINKWIIYYSGTELGYFPDSIWSGKFTSVGQVEAFGEVAANSSTKPTTQMGNGVLGTLTNSAYFKNMKLINPKTLNTFVYSSQQAPAVYKVGYYVSSCTNNCSANYGGPGY